MISGGTESIAISINVSFAIIFFFMFIFILLTKKLDKKRMYRIVLLVLSLLGFLFNIICLLK